MHADGAGYWPTKSWRSSTPEQQGMDSGMLADMLGYIQEQGIRIHSLLVIRNGYIVTEAYFHPFQQDTEHYLASCAKSFTSALVGIAVEKGYIENVNHRVLDYLPSRVVANQDPRKGDITLEHLLTMTSGLDWPTHGLQEQVGPQMLGSNDWVQFVLDRPMVEGPGAQFDYNSGGSHLLSAIIQEVTGMDTLTLAQKDLFEPLGMSVKSWSSDPGGINTGGWGIQMVPRDMARFGYLYLRKGTWNGRQIISDAWVRTSAMQHIATSYYGYQYGYQWWVHPTGVYHARGLGGQRIFVLPKQRMVVTFTSGLNFPAMEEVPEALLEEFIIPAAKSSESLPENPGLELFDSRIKTIAQPEPQPALPLPSLAQRISGKMYILEDNPYDWRAFVVDFQEEQARLSLSFGNGSRQVVVGLDGVYRTTQAKPIGFLNGAVALRGSWEDSNSFLLSLQFLNGICFDMRLDFSETDVNIHQLLARRTVEIRGRLSS